MVAVLVGLSFIMGPIQMLKLYGVPYWVGSNSSCFDALWYQSSLSDCHIGFFEFGVNAGVRHMVGLGDLLASPWP